MKKTVSGILSITMIMCMCISALAVNNSDAAHEAQYEVIETYNILCEKYDQNEEKAMEELLSLYPSLEIVDSSVKYFDTAGRVVQPTRSTMNDVSL